MTEVEMRELKAGDRVRDRSELRGVVESNDEGRVMIRWAGEYVTYNALTFAPYLTLLPDPQPSPLTEEHVAWLRYDRRNDNPDLKYLHLCDSDTLGAFKVYRHCRVPPIIDSSGEDIAYRYLEDERDELLAALRVAHETLKLTGNEHNTEDDIDCECVACEARAALLKRFEGVG